MLALRTLSLAALTTAALFTSTSTIAQTGYAAVWRPGTGTQWWRSGMTFDQFKAQDTTYFNQGLRIQSLAIRDGRYAAVWRTGTGTQWWRSGMTFDQFKAQDTTYFNQGLRLQAIELDGGRYAAVWRPGTGTQWWRTGMTFDQFKAQDTTYFNQGLRLRVLEIDGGRYTAVWRPGSGTQWWRSGMTGADLEAQDRTYFQQGLRMTAMAIDGDRYAAVWQTGSGAQWYSYRRCFTDFRTEDAARFASGLRMNFIELQGDPAGAWRYPWKSGVSFGVGQGNNNPPPGSHNGSQAFAFDFSLPAGTTIRAVRDGTVEWLQEGQTTTYNPNQADSPTNQPFPAGSLQNWGNAVRIRHAGGFTSWYFHVQPNGVTVNVGDTVQRGQPIAISGNTGRSSGAHLHFQVQADSTDWGLSVPINFQSACQAPTGGDSVTSNNANGQFP